MRLLRLVPEPGADGNADEIADTSADERADGDAYLSGRVRPDVQAGPHDGQVPGRDHVHRCVAVGVASAAVGLFLVAVDAGASAGIDCLSLPSRLDAPEEKEADELEPVSPASL